MSIPFDLRQLRALCVLARTGSFTQAARDLHLTQSAVSHSMKALERETARRGTSLNETVLELLRRGLGVDPATRRSNGLRKLAGRWSPKEHADFERSLEIFSTVDPELWS